ncbi:hypothetical protein EVAR_100822_1 [Eumeta japonica]|uniref:Uncharacterized protein n=1 Tax=Eumeta variegata TaxID=151549 RepID=A0A4C2A9R8_EUMVA|nr:hypothetical protein EVAR_100822_1 [Eumeta japonica]
MFSRPGMEIENAIGIESKNGIAIGSDGGIYIGFKSEVGIGIDSEITSKIKSGSTIIEIKSKCRIRIGEISKSIEIQIKEWEGHWNLE